MKILKFFLLGLVLFLGNQIVFSQTINLPAKFHKHLTGTINNTININMELIGKNNKLSGSYFYRKVGTNIWLSGKYESTGKIQMIESVNGKMVGKFEGVFQSEKRIMGTWSDSAGTKKMPFILNENYTNSVQFEEDTAYAQYHMFNNPEKPTFDITIFMAYPVYSENPAILPKIQETVEKGFFGVEVQGNTIQEKINNFVNNQLNSYKENEKDYAANNQDGEMDNIYNWMTDISNSFLLNDFGILSVGYYTSEYTGGAHGSSSQTYQVIEMATGNIIQLTDFLNPGFESTINTLVTKSFKEQNKTDILSEIGFYSDTIVYTQNFYLTKEGIYFAYNPYEIAPYMMGQQEALVPFSDIKEWIKPNSVIKELTGF